MDKYNRAKGRRKMKKIGFIGIGVMGNSMAHHLMQKGYEVAVYTRTKSKAEALILEGATWCESVAACAKGRDAVITMVGYPKDVEEVYFKEDGIIASADEGTYIIDMTTTSPKLSIKIDAAAREKGLHALDAPVSGGDVGAQKGTLAIMVGGEKADFEACYSIFECMGTNIVYEGKAGNGQHTKMANQIALGGVMASLCEAMTYSKSVGLDIDTMLSTISQGAAGSWQMSNMAPRIAKGDLNPGFYIKHYIKDMKIALEEAENAGVQMGMMEKILGMYEALEKEGFGELGTQALIKYYER